MGDTDLNENVILIFRGIFLTALLKLMVKESI